MNEMKDKTKVMASLVFAAIVVLCLLPLAAGALGVGG